MPNKKKGMGAEGPKRSVARKTKYELRRISPPLKRGSSKSKVTRSNPGDGYVESTIKTPKKGTRMTPVYTGAGGRGPSGNTVVTKKGKTTRVARAIGRGQTVTRSYISTPKRGKTSTKTIKGQSKMRYGNR
jgi:hypothetical protein